MNRVLLGEITKYADSRVDSSKLSIGNYIGTDNIRQNKAGKNLSRYVPTAGQATYYKKNDILVANIRPYLKKIWFADRDGGSSPDVSVIRVNDDGKFLPEFVYYNLFQDSFFDYAMKGAKGSKMPRIDKHQIMSFPIANQSVKSQIGIVKSLNILDKKISLNNSVNVKLESIARLIYEQWLIQFDFPDENNQPYKATGGTMVYNEDLKRNIPIGWSVKRLDDVISRSGTGLNPRKNFKLGSGKNYYVTIKNVENGKVILDDKCDKINDDALRIIQKRSDLQKGDILFTSIQPVGVTYLIQEKPANWNINESVFTLRPNYRLVTSDYLFMLASSAEIKVYTENSSAGSVHKGIRHSTLKEFKFAYPGKLLVDRYSNIISPILRQIYVNDKESRELAKLRDWLLPMLISGQIKVEE